MSKLKWYSQASRLMKSWLCTVRRVILTTQCFCVNKWLCHEVHRSDRYFKKCFPYQQCRSIPAIKERAGTLITMSIAKSHLYTIFEYYGESMIFLFPAIFSHFCLSVATTRLISYRIREKVWWSRRWVASDDQAICCTRAMPQRWKEVWGGKWLSSRVKNYTVGACKPIANEIMRNA